MHDLKIRAWAELCFGDKYLTVYVILITHDKFIIEIENKGFDYVIILIV